MQYPHYDYHFQEVLFCSTFFVCLYSALAFLLELYSIRIFYVMYTIAFVLLLLLLLLLSLLLLFYYYYYYHWYVIN